jgi:hypothetical protein
MKYVGLSGHGPPTLSSSLKPVIPNDATFADTVHLATSAAVGTSKVPGH